MTDFICNILTLAFRETRPLYGFDKFFFRKTLWFPAGFYNLESLVMFISHFSILRSFMTLNSLEFLFLRRERISDFPKRTIWELLLTLQPRRTGCSCRSCLMPRRQFSSISWVGRDFLISSIWPL